MGPVRVTPSIVRIWMWVSWAVAQRWLNLSMMSWGWSSMEAWIMLVPTYCLETRVVICRVVG
eukprot:4655765-Heterocapsa_arctica.AAC.1